MKDSIWKPLYGWWKPIAEKIVAIQSLIILSLLYFTLFMVFNIIIRLLFIDLLDKRIGSKQTYWYKKSQLPANLLTYRHQF